MFTSCLATCRSRTWRGRWRRVTPLNTSKVTMKFSRPELKIKSKQMNIFNIKKRSAVTDSICSLAETCTANICSGDGQTDQSMDLLSWLPAQDGLIQNNWSGAVYIKLRCITRLQYVLRMTWRYVSGKHVICCSKILSVMKNTTCKQLKHLIKLFNKHRTTEGGCQRWKCDEEWI